jgi:hypothetical protein
MRVVGSPKVIHYGVHFDAPEGQESRRETLGSGFLLVGLKPTPQIACNPPRNVVQPRDMAVARRFTRLGHSQPHGDNLRSQESVEAGVQICAL